MFRYIIDKEHELGPFAYVVNELAQHETFGELVKNLEIVTIKLNEQELGINLFEKFFCCISEYQKDTKRISSKKFRTKS